MAKTSTYTNGVNLWGDISNTDKYLIAAMGNIMFTALFSMKQMLTQTTSPPQGDTAQRKDDAV